MMLLSRLAAWACFAAVVPTLLLSSAAPVSAGLFCLNDCSGHGVCAFQNPFDRTRTDWIWERRCFCDRGWTGTDCSRCSASDVCGDRKLCRFGECRCPIGWEGDACERCYSSVGCGHGKCFDMKCVCDAGWSGIDCTTPMPVDPLAPTPMPTPSPTL